MLVESTGEWIQVNEFQHGFWTDANRKGTWLSASAPTASGKTYIVLRWLVDRLIASNARVAVYLAPTRALVSEIEGAVRFLLRRADRADIAVSSLPLRGAGGHSSEKTKIIYVVTQERLHMLANLGGADFKVDLLVVDEAHKVGDRLRGVILQEAIERVVRNNQSAKTVFISPSTQNPEILLDDAPDGVERLSFDSDTPTVMQNLILATQVPRKPKEWTLSLRTATDTLPLGLLQLRNRPVGIRKRLAFLAAAIGEKGGTLVYANGAAEAEEVALLISQLVPHSLERGVESELAALADLARRGVHRSYQLAPLVERGVAFHYGNMPSLLRLEIERLFRSGKLRFLVCTSTLVEGVNLSCRTIVLRGPTKGRGQAMLPHDFWNLAGRAGRWGSEFQGNIVCVDPDDVRAWPTGVPQRTRYSIARETDEILARANDLKSFIATRWDMQSGELMRSSQLEAVSAYLLTAYRRDGSISDAPFAKRHPVETIDALDDVLQQISERISIPHEIAARHAGVSVVGMQKLSNYFDSRVGDVEDILLAPPESDDAYARMIAVFKRINEHLFPAFLPDGLIPLHALIVLEWLRGLSLAQMIASRIRYHRERGNTIQLPVLIRSTMELVEQTARFRAPRYLSAYMDVVKLHLEKIGREDLLVDEFDIGLALEFGISTQTLVSLVELGLSRMSAVAIYEKMAQDDLSQAECRAWMSDRQNELEGMDLPAAIVREIREKVLGSEGNAEDGLVATEE